MQYGALHNKPDLLPVLGRFGWVHMNLWAGYGLDRMKAIVAAIKAVNPKCVTSNYTCLIDMMPAGLMPTADLRKPLLEAVDRNDWWLRNAAGARVTQQGGYSNYDVNIAPGVMAGDIVTGKTFTRMRAEWDVANLFPAGVFDMLWCDNLYNTTRAPADWFRTGTDNPVRDPLASQAMRKGFAEYYGHLRELIPGVPLGGNCDGNADTPEIKGLVDNLFLEGQMGKSYSPESWGGWAEAMKRYRLVLAAVRTKGEVAFQVYGTKDDFALMRYGLASSLQDDGYFIYSPTDGDTRWYDEFDAPMGAPIEAAMMIGSISARRYENGIALVNTSKVANAGFDCKGYRRLSGTQDPAVNNGAVCGLETIPPRSGLILVKV